MDRLGRLRRHRALGHHVIWVLVAVALLICTWVTVGRDDASIFVAPFAVAVVWGTLGVGWGLVLGREEETGKRGKRPPPQGLRPPWAWPTVLAYAVPVLAGALVLPLATGADDAGLRIVIVPFAMLVGWLGGVCVALLGLVVWICLIGIVGFGRPLVTGEVDGEPVPRAPYVGPFVATAALLALPLTLAGAGSYDSPYRRDVLPLLGVVRDGVRVEHPVLLGISQVATWVMVGGLAGGWLVHRVVGRRASRPQG